MLGELEEYKVHEFVAHSTMVNCLTIGPLSNQVLATGGEDCKVNVWRVGNASNIWTLGQNKSPIECLCFDNDEQYLVSGALNGSLKIFDLNEGKLARSLLGHQVNTCSINYHPFGEFIVSGSIDNTMKVWDVRNKTCIQTYTGHEKEITCVKFSPDGRWVASSGKDGQLFLWDLIAGKLINSIRIQPTMAYVTSFEFNPSEFLLAAVTSAKSVRLWDLETMEQIGYSTPDTSPIRCMSFASQGTTLCTATSDTIKVWSWDPVTLKGVTSISWDKVTEIRVNNENQLVGGSCTSNFASVWAVDVDAIIAAGVPQHRDEEKREREQRAKERDREKEREKEKPTSRPKPISGRPPIDSPFSYAADAKSMEEDSKQADKLSALLIQGQGAGSVAAAAKPATTPEVQWTGANSKEMATSMGESFFQRFKEAQEEKAKAGMNIGMLAGMLPSQAASRFPSGVGAPSNGAGMPSGLGVADRGLPARRVRKPAPNYNNNKSEGPIPTSSSSTSTSNTYSNNNNNLAINNNSNYNIAKERERDRSSSATPPDSLEIIGSKHKKNNNEIQSYNDAKPHSSAATPSSVPCFVPQQAPIVAGAPSYDAIDEDHETTLLELDKLIGGSSAVTAVLQQRISALRMLRRLWEKADMENVIAQLQMLHEGSLLDNRQLTVIVHFFNAVEFRGSGVNLDLCCQLLPILVTLLTQEYCLQFDHYILAALHTIKSLLEAFGDLIRQTRAVVVAGGVDLSREDRLQKCNRCYNLFCKIRDGIDKIKRLHRKNAILIEQSDIVQSLLESL